MKSKNTQKKLNINKEKDLIKKEKDKEMENIKNIHLHNDNENNKISLPLKIGHYHEADEYQKCNEYILRGYRMNFDTSNKIFQR